MAEITGTMEWILENIAGLAIDDVAAVTFSMGEDIRDRKSVV